MRRRKMIILTALMTLLVMLMIMTLTVPRVFGLEIKDPNPDDGIVPLTEEDFLTIMNKLKSQDKENKLLNDENIQLKELVKALKDKIATQKDKIDFMEISFDQERTLYDITIDSLQDSLDIANSIIKDQAEIIKLERKQKEPLIDTIDIILISIITGIVIVN